MFYVLIALLVTLQFFIIKRKRATFLSLSTVSIIIFSLLLLPKIILYDLIEADVFTTYVFRISTPSVQAAKAAIIAFLFSIQAVYLIGPRLAPKPARPEPPGNYIRVIQRYRFFIKSIFFPLSVVYLLFFISLKGFDMEGLFSKGVFHEEGQITFLYYVQKVGFFVKIPFYIALLKLIIVGRIESRSDLWILVLATAFCFALFMFSGQRSGIFLTILELLTALLVAGKLRMKIILVMGGFFIFANAAILTVRFADAGQLAFYELVLRRYFFDFEKVAGIISLWIHHSAYETGLLPLFFSVSEPIHIDGNIHFIIGEMAFGFSGGIPPSILGEILIYLGGWAIIPATLICTLIYRKVEGLMLYTSSPAIAVIAIILCSHFTYFALNSDLLSFLKRSALDLIIFMCGYLLFNVAVFRRKTVFAVRAKASSAVPPGL